MENFDSLSFWLGLALGLINGVALVCKVNPNLVGSPGKNFHIQKRSLIFFLLLLLIGPQHLKFTYGIFPAGYNCHSGFKQRVARNGLIDNGLLLLGHTRHQSQIMLFYQPICKCFSQFKPNLFF